MATLVLIPFAFALGGGNLSDLESGMVYDTPPAIGDGGLDDDSDVTGAELGAYGVDPGHIEAVTADFRTPPGIVPTAALVQIRARNNAEVVASPPTETRLLYARLSDTVTDASYNVQALGNVPPEAWWAGPLTVAEVTTPTWYTGWYQNHPDLEDPTDAGNWFELSGFPDAAAALMDDGLRVTLGWRWLGGARLAWVDLFEVRLLIAYEPRRRPSCIRHRQRGDGLGASSAPRGRQNSTQQASLRGRGIR